MTIKTVSYISELRHVYLFRVRVWLGLGLVSFRFNDKNAFSKLKKKKFRFQPCTHWRMCVYGRYASGYHFENNSSNNNNYNYYLLQRIQQSEALHLQYLHYKSPVKTEI